MEALLLQSNLLLWKRVPKIRRPAAAPSMLPRVHAQRSPAQHMGRLQLSGVMSQYFGHSMLLVFGFGLLETREPRVFQFWIEVDINYARGINVALNTTLDR
jgi:hypothetical protein